MDWRLLPDWLRIVPSNTYLKWILLDSERTFSGSYKVQMEKLIFSVKNFFGPILCPSLCCFVKIVTIVLCNYCVIVLKAGEMKKKKKLYLTNLVLTNSVNGKKLLWKLNTNNWVVGISDRSSPAYVSIINLHNSRLSNYLEFSLETVSKVLHKQKQKNNNN